MRRKEANLDSYSEGEELCHEQVTARLELATTGQETRTDEFGRWLIAEYDSDDEFDKIYKGEISKSGAAILPSKRVRRLPEKIFSDKEEEKEEIQESKQVTQESKEEIREDEEQELSKPEKVDKTAE